MYATPQIQQLLYDLQSLDNDARRIRHEAEELEETKQLEQVIVQRKTIAVERKKLADKIATVRSRNDEIDSEVEQLKAQVDAINTKLKADGVTPKEVVALTQQQEGVTAKIGPLEDEQVEVMAQAEDLERDDDIAKHNDDHLNETGLELKQRRDGKIEGLKKRMESVRNRRKVAVTSIPEDVLDLYTKFVEQGNLNPVILFVNGRVQESVFELTPVQLHEIEQTDRDQLVIYEDERIIIARP